jgi:hypothetical protein
VSGTLAVLEGMRRANDWAPVRHPGRCLFVERLIAEPGSF